MAFGHILLVPLLVIALSASLNSCASSGDRVAKQLIAEYHPPCQMDLECRRGFICMYIDADDPNGYCEVEVTRGEQNYPCTSDMNCNRRRGLLCIYSTGFSNHGHCLYPAGVMPGIPSI